MQSLFFFIIALSILVVVHEFGHFWVARRCGVKVLKFSVGFGQPLWKKLGRDGTEYILAAIPLGGYVKMLDEREGEVPPEQLEHAFNRKSLAARTAIVAAGPIANLLFAVFAYWLIFIIGIPGVRPIIGEVAIDSPAAYAQFKIEDEIKQVNDNKTPTWSSVRKALYKIAESGGVARITIESGGIDVHKELDVPKVSLDQAAAKPLLQSLGFKQIEYRPIVGQVVADGAADKSGLLEGDLLHAFEGETIATWTEWVKIIQAHPNMKMDITVKRVGEKINLTITPNDDAIIGVGVAIPDEFKTELRYGVVEAVGYAVQETWDFSSSTVKGLLGMLVGTVSSKNIGGPITIAQIAGASAEQGFLPFIYFLAMISVSLGILNLLPIPILDGGHLVMNFIEWLRGKPLSEGAQIQGQKVGIILLLSLMFLAFFNDLSRLFGS